MTPRRQNVFEDACEGDATDPEGFRSAVFAPGATANGNALAVKVFEILVGQSICPYH